MTSKEVVNQLKEDFENDVYKVEREMLDVVEKDLDILELLRKYIYFDAKDNYIKMFDIKECITNFDFEILMDWLENKQGFQGGLKYGKQENI